MANDLTPKQQRFVDEYLVDLNATQAAIRAGYSARSARAIGLETLAKPAVESALGAARQRLAERTRRTVAQVMAEIRRIGDQAELEGEWMPALKARELEAKHLGAFEPEGGGQTNVAIVIQLPPYAKTL